MIRGERRTDRVLVMIETLRSWHGIPPTVREVAAFCRLTTGGVQGKVALLRRRGLVVADHPRRQRGLVLTDAGHERLEELLPLVRPRPLGMLVSSNEEGP